MFLTVERLFVEKREEGYEDECNNFLYEVANLYERCEMLGIPAQMDETNGRVCLFQMNDLERDTKLEGCRALPGISD